MPVIDKIPPSRFAVLFAILFGKQLTMAIGAYNDAFPIPVITPEALPTCLILIE
jgi:hypothetical protein